VPKEARYVLIIEIIGPLKTINIGTNETELYLVKQFSPPVLFE